MKFFKWLFGDNSDYKYEKGQVVYFYDKKYTKVRTMVINHKMSSWGDYNNWEYYHCSCGDPKESWYSIHLNNS